MKTNNILSAGKSSEEMKFSNGISFFCPFFFFSWISIIFERVFSAYFFINPRINKGLEVMERTWQCRFFLSTKMRTCHLIFLSTPKYRLNGKVAWLYWINLKTTVSLWGASLRGPSYFVSLERVGNASFPLTMYLEETTSTTSFGPESYSVMNLKRILLQ